MPEEICYYSKFSEKNPESIFIRPISEKNIRLENLIYRLSALDSSQNDARVIIDTCTLFFRLSTKRGGCIPEAQRLMAENGSRGSVYWVEHWRGIPVCHAYYVPDQTETGARALNQADNGYEGFPALNVQEVLKHGTPMNSQPQVDAMLLAAMLKAKK